LDGATTSGDEFFLYGLRTPGPANYLDVFKFDNFAALEWSQEILFDTTLVTSVYPASIINSTNGTTYIIGSFVTPNLSSPGFVTAISSAGAVQWTVSLTYGVNGITLNNAVTAANGDLLLTGLYVYGGIGGSFVARISAAGSLLWIKDYTPSGGAGSNYIINKTATAGQYILNGLDYLDEGLELAMIDDNGNLLWGRYVIVGAGQEYTPYGTFYNSSNASYNVITRGLTTSHTDEIMATSINPATGAVLSAVSYDFPDGIGNLSNVASNNDTGLVFAGNYQANGLTIEKLYYAATNADITMVNQGHSLTMPGFSQDIYGLTALASGSLIIDGNFVSTYNNSYLTQNFYCKTDPTGGGLCTDTAFVITSTLPALLILY
jgi:hypothetical protein